jgi:hypothetical protein
MLHTSLPALGEGGWHSPLLSDHGEDPGGPQGKITIPGMELVAAVHSVRLARKVREALKIPLSAMRYFTDSSAVLGMLRTESGKFLEFVGARVSEVKVNSDVENEW